VKQLFTFKPFHNGVAVVYQLCGFDSFRLKDIDNQYLLGSVTD